ncbi:hypothetical protein [Haloferula sp. BvORR071]|uniref:hypothetical protein n=1 Tax=Haloferula sp. BvORR071 TaxID=1396141 RepID=UPI002240F5EF|nr:hypothetical protein [Haloferula sp. BvORR071]
MPDGEALISWAFVAGQRLEHTQIAEEGWAFRLGDPALQNASIKHASRTAKVVMP